MYRRVIVIILSLLLHPSLADKKKWHHFNNPNYLPGRDVMVHLFEWKWNDIADECERFLGPMGFAGVQTSPVTENRITKSRSWLERYEPISYHWITRSGNEHEFKSMVRRCNRVGVRIYADVVFNHMTQEVGRATGTGGSVAETGIRYYPAVPYDWNHFNPRCEVHNMSDPEQLRNCRVVGHDLNQKIHHVRVKISDLLNNLNAAGVAGYRIDSAGYMWNDDLRAIYSSLESLNVDHNFPITARPYIYQAVADFDGDVISKWDYNSLAPVTEVRYGLLISSALKGLGSLKRFKNPRELKDLLPSAEALVFIDNHQTQRVLRDDILTHKSPRLYRMAVAFMLAYPYGNPRIMSSFAFVNDRQGPPADRNRNIISPIIKEDGSCRKRWICEHRWRQIYNMVAFRTTVSGTTIDDWWDNDSNQIAFSRGDKGFIAINPNNTTLESAIPTRLSPGDYCDVISGNLIDGSCSGRIIRVDENGEAHVKISENNEDGVIAIHRDVSTYVNDFRK